MLLGSLNDTYRGENISNIKVNRNYIKCLGIYFGYNKGECYERNWTNTVKDMEKLFESWKKRKLTIFGKCEIINTLAVSKLIYVASVLSLPNDTLIKDVNRLIYKFLWNSRDRIKRNTLIGPVKSGGINVVDIVTKLKALKSSGVSRLLKNKGQICMFLNSILRNNKCTLNYILKMNDTVAENFSFLKNVPQFYKEVFTCFNECKKLIPIDKMTVDSFFQQPLWNNKYFTYKGKTVCFTRWIKSNILYVKDIFNENGMKDINEIGRLLQDKQNWLCEYRIIHKIFRTNIINRFDKSIVGYINIKDYHKFLFLNVYDDIEHKKCKFFYKILLQKRFQVPCYQSFLNRMYDLSMNSWGNIYHHKITLAYDKDIAQFNYKLLNNLLCNNLYLSKWKREVNKYCTFCKTQVENTEHLLYECGNVKDIWIILDTVLNIDIKWKHILLGLYNECNEKVIFLNNVISFVALKIYKFKMFCRLENLDESEYNIRFHLKRNLKFWFNTLKYNKYTYRIDTIHLFSDIL